MNQDSMHQLVLVKYLFQRGEEELDTQNEMACGVAVSHFQDAIEMLLYLTVNEKKLHCKQNTFDGLLRSVNSCTESRLPFHHEILGLNKARVSFKHYGTPPAVSAAEKYLLYTRRFLVEVAKTLLNIDFESISLADLVANEEIQTTLKRAEHHLREQEFTECIEQCAKAHELASDSMVGVVPPMTQSGAIFIRNPSTGKQSIIEQGDYLNVIREISLAALFGIPAHDFLRYATLNKSLVLQEYLGDKSGPGSDDTEESQNTEINANFAIRYVTDYVLKLESWNKS